MLLDICVHHRSEVEIFYISKQVNDEHLRRQKDGHHGLIRGLRKIPRREQTLVLREQTVSVPYEN